MTIFHSIILGIVEGITEFLPISSTAHLEIASRILGIANSDFLKSFEIVIQLGAILAVVVLYASRLRTNVAIWKRVIVAFIPTAIIGFLLYKLIKNFLLGNIAVAAWALLVGGVIIIIFEYIHTKKVGAEVVIDEETSLKELENMPYATAVIIGLAQALAVIPGVSRSAATIISGMSLKIRRVAIVEFSFLLAIPTMLAASGYDLLKSASSFSASQASLLFVGFVISFIAALFSVQFFLKFIQKHNFMLFGVYRIVLALILFGTMIS